MAVPRRAAPHASRSHLAPAEGVRVQDHEELMRRALGLAARGWGRVSPNPMVGAVVVRDGQVVGEGWFVGPRGRPHAEVVALAAAGERSRGATLYCTLEPCDHHGSTPPCTEAILASGVSRVVVAAGDPNPLVDGRGVARLREGGVDVVEGILEADAHRLNAAFERHVTTGRPFVTWKTAATLDGKSAAVDGSSRWITGEDARADVHRLRAGADAIVVGAGTAIADDPALTARGPEPTGRSPLRVVVDSSGRVPCELHVFDEAAPTLVATTDRARPASISAWTARGAEVVVLDRDADDRVCIEQLLSHLGKRDVQGLLLEGGPTLAWSFVTLGLVDRVVAYLAPKLVGGSGAPGALGGVGFAPIDRALGLDLVSVERLGDDLRVEADVHGDR